MKKHFLIFLISICLLGILATYTFVFAMGTGDGEDTRISLQGITGLYVIISIAKGADDVLNELSVTEEQLRTVVELKLRLAGIKVVSKNDILNIPGMPQLIVTVSGWKTALGDSNEILFSLGTDVELGQLAYLKRNPTIEMVAVTWSLSGFARGSSSKKSQTRQHLRDLIMELSDRFINAYLSVNHKGGK